MSPERNGIQPAAAVESYYIHLYSPKW